MKKKEIIFLGLSLLHLTIVGLGASQITIAHWPLLGKPLIYYGSLSGAGHSYGFFAPGVGSAFRVEFDIDKNHESFIAKLDSHYNREAELRLSNLLGLISKTVEDERIRRSVAASWAGKMFARYPGAQSVTVRLEMHGLPTMAFYKTGTRFNWEPFYRAKFVRAQAQAIDVSTVR